MLCRLVVLQQNDLSRAQDAGHIVIIHHVNVDKKNQQAVMTPCPCMQLLHAPGCICLHRLLLAGLQPYCRLTIAWYIHACARAIELQQSHTWDTRLQTVPHCLHIAGLILLDVKLLMQTAQSTLQPDVGAQCAHWSLLCPNRLYQAATPNTSMQAPAQNLAQPAAAPATAACTPASRKPKASASCP